MSATFPVARLRRLRRTAPLRRLVSDVSVRPGDLILPLFVKEGIAEPQPVSSMPGVVQHTRDSLRKAAAEAVDAGVGGLILFGIPTITWSRSVPAVSAWSKSKDAVALPLPAPPPLIRA